MAASRVDILLEQGGDFTITVDLVAANGNPWDLTGYSAVAKVRQNPSDASPVLVLTATVSAPPTNGTVTIAATSAQTAAIPVSFQLGYWELDITSGAGVVYPIYKGLARMTPWIAR